MEKNKFRTMESLKKIARFRKEWYKFEENFNISEK